MVFRLNSTSPVAINTVAANAISDVKKSILDGGEVRNLDAVINIEGVRKAGKILNLPDKQINISINNLLTAMGVEQKYFGLLKNLNPSVAVARAGEVLNLLPSDIEANQNNFISQVDALSAELVKNVKLNNSSLTVEAAEFGRNFSEQLNTINDHDL
jgi:hypothetical protein